MPTRITAAELAANLSDILDRVYGGEEFVVERAGEVVAHLRPAREARGITARELVDRIGNLPMPGDGFADDLEAVQAEQPKATAPPWDCLGGVE